MNPAKRSPAKSRRANVIYFLSRDGRVEHPHLIRVHHYCHSGVRLRDVKKWLSDSRGKDLPESFSWSFQRRYKEGFVWQDLVNDDLIIPISDREYVLMGSLLPGAASSSSLSPTAESKSDLFSSPELSATPEKEGLEAGDCVEASSKEESPLKEVEEEGASPAGESGGRGYPWKASHVLRALLTCRSSDSVDGAMFAAPLGVSGDGDGSGGVQGAATKTVGPTLRPPLRFRSSFGSNNSSSFERERGPTVGGKSSRKAGTSGRRHMAKPKCSQCGNPFNPEKLHSHMKSCRGLKGRGFFANKLRTRCFLVVQSSVYT